MGDPLGQTPGSEAVGDRHIRHRERQFHRIVIIDIERVAVTLFSLLVGFLVVLLLVVFARRGFFIGRGAIMGPLTRHNQDTHIWIFTD